MANLYYKGYSIHFHNGTNVTFPVSFISGVAMMLIYILRYIGLAIL